LLTVVSAGEKLVLVVLGQCPAAPGTDPDGDPRSQRRRTRPRVRARRWHLAGGRGQRPGPGALRLIPHEQEREHLLTLTGLIEAGKLTPVLDRTYPLAGTAEGRRRVEQGHARGKIVITVA